MSTRKYWNRRLTVRWYPSFRIWKGSTISDFYIFLRLLYSSIQLFAAYLFTLMIEKLIYLYYKQPIRVVPRKRCSENIQQIYRRTPMPKCDFNKVALQLYWNHTSAWVFSGKFAAYFQNTFSWEHLWVAASDTRTFLKLAVSHSHAKVSNTKD